MTPQTIRLYVPYSTEPPWIVRRETSRVGTFDSRSDAVRAAVAMRSKLTRAWGLIHPPICVQELDGSWHDIEDAAVTSYFG